jgi:hypothetical protein
MKISSPTKAIITSMTAASGSSAQPRLIHWEPNCIQRKFTTCRLGLARLSAKAQRDSASEIPMEPMASPAESRRCLCFSSALMAAASAGSTGMSQSECTMNAIG